MVVVFPRCPCIASKSNEMYLVVHHLEEISDMYIYSRIHLMTSGSGLTQQKQLPALVNSHKLRLLLMPKY